MRSNVGVPAGESVLEWVLTAAVRAAEQRRRLEEVGALEERISVLRAHQVTLLAGYAEVAAATVDASGRPEIVDPMDGAAEELAVAMTWTAHRAGTALDEATALVRRLPATLATLATGRVDYPRAQTVVRALLDLDDEAASVVDAAVAPSLAGLTTAQLRDRCEREVLAVDAEAAARRHRRRSRERRVALRGAGDGMAVLSVEGPAAALLCGYDGLTARARAARRHDPHRRTLDQIRFDLLVTSLGGVAGPGCGPAADLPVDGRAVPAVPALPSPSATVGVTIAASTLLGHDETPGELAGYGPIAAEVARTLALHPDSRLRRLVVDDRTGALLPPPSVSCGHETPADGGDARRQPYRPGAALDRYVRARDPRCTAPGCRAPAYRCDVDHIVAWPHGPTCACNLHPLCRRHHRAKHEAGWVAHRHVDGSTAWTTTNGLEVTSAAQPALPRPSASASASASARHPATPAESKPGDVAGGSRRGGAGDIGGDDGRAKMGGDATAARADRARADRARAAERAEQVERATPEEECERADLGDRVDQKPIDRHSVDPHSIDPHSIDPHSVDPHSVDPHSIDPEPFGLRALRARLARRARRREDPGRPPF